MASTSPDRATATNASTKLKPWRCKEARLIRVLPGLDHGGAVPVAGAGAGGGSQSHLHLSDARRELNPRERVPVRGALYRIYARGGADRDRIIRQHGHRVELVYGPGSHL